MKEKKEIIKDTFRLTSARYISQFFGVFTSIAMRRFIGPFYTGVWSILSIIADYTSYLLLGVNEGATYKIPVLLGQEKEQEAEEVKGVAFNFIFAVSCLTSLGVLVAAIVLHKRYPIEITVGLAALSLYILADRLCGYYMLLLRARSNFIVLSRSIIFDAVINLVLIMLVVRNYGIYGLYFTIITLAIINTLYIHMLAKYRINLTFKLKGLGSLMKLGLPITILGLLEWTLASIDRIMIAKFIGVIYVGYYSISIMTKNYVAQLSSFGTVLYPKVLSTFGKNKNIEDIKKYVITPTKINAYLLPLVLGPIFFIAPILIKLVLPKFIPGILAIQILLIDMFFRTCYPQATYFLIALKKQVRIIPILVIAIILSILGNYLLLKKGFGIYGVALATSIVSIFTFVATQTYAMKHFASRKEIVLFFAEILAPFLYSLMVILLLERVVKMNNVYIQIFVKSSLFLFLSIPSILYINKKTGIIGLVFNAIKEMLHV